MEESTKEPQSFTVENESREDIILDSTEETKLSSHVHRTYVSADSGRTSWTQKKNAGLKLYFGLLPPKTFPFKNCSNVNVPTTKTIKETLHSNLHGSFNIRNPFDVLPIGSEDIQKSAKVRKFLNWQFTNEINFNSLLDAVLDFCLIYGHAVVKCRYVKESRKRKTPIEGPPSAEALAVQANGGELNEEDEVTFDGVKAEVLNPESVLFPIDETTADVDEMDHVIHEVIMSTSDIRRKIASGEYREVDLGKPQSVGENESETILRDTRDQYIGLNRGDTRTQGSPLGSKFYKILEWYGFYDVDGDGIEESIMVAMLLDSRKILRVVSWDISRPFRIIRFSPIFNTPFGESVPDLLGKINEELNTLHNQRVDAVTISNIPFGFYDPASGFDPDKIEYTPGVLYPTNGQPQNAVYFPPMQPVRPEMYREEEILISLAERLLGAGANTQGVAQSRRTSATEISTIDRRAGIRFFTIFKRIQEGLEEVGKLVLELDQMFMPAVKQVRVMGANDFPLFERRVTFDSLTKDEMQGKFDVIAIGESIADQEANKQEQLAIYQLGITNPLIAMDPESLYELTKDTLMALGDKNVGAHLKKPQVAVPQNPEDEHNRMAQGERVDPVQGENYDYHLAKHAEFINSPQFLLLPQEAQLEVMRHFQNTIRVKQLTLQMMQLQSQQMMMQGKAQQEGQEQSLDRQAAREAAVKANGNKS